ncbi:MAG: phage protein GemA/Gp16 family protein [Pseudomonadota bacterium]
MRLVVDNSRQMPPSGERRTLLAQVHIARKQLAIAEDDYRAVLCEVTGHSSAKDCSVAELRAALLRFERLGFKVGKPIGRRDLGGGVTIGKSRAMWISLYQLGAIDDRSDAALESFGRRQLGVERLRWASERETFRLIEALKAIAERHGWSQRLPRKLEVKDGIRLLKDRLVGAQLELLRSAGVEPPRHLAVDRNNWSDAQLESAAAELADPVRACRLAKKNVARKELMQ